MPVGYSEDVRLPEFLKRAKNKLDILTYKLKKAKREFEAAESEYNRLEAQYEVKEKNRLSANVKPEISKAERRRPDREED